MEQIKQLDKFLISQKLIAMKGKYHIYNESGQEISYIEQARVFQLKKHLVAYSDSWPALSSPVGERR